MWLLKSQARRRAATRGTARQWELSWRGSRGWLLRQLQRVTARLGAKRIVSLCSAHPLAASEFVRLEVASWPLFCVEIQAQDTRIKPPMSRLPDAVLCAPQGCLPTEETTCIILPTADMYVTLQRTRVLDLD